MGKNPKRSDNHASNQPENTDLKSHLAFGAYAWFRRASRLKKFVVVIVVAVVALFAVGVFAFQFLVPTEGRIPAAKELLESSGIVNKNSSSSDAGYPQRIIVYFPDPTLDGAPYKDGRIQRSGFDEALKSYRDSFPKSPIPIFREYRFEREENYRHVSDLVKEMRAEYENGARVFIVTMSGAIATIREEFKTWHDEIQNKDDAPILISTVASAPGVADAKHDIYRFYIRSEEEACQLSRFAAWRLDADRAGVFVISKSVNTLNESYGKGAADTISEEFEAVLGGKVELFPILSDGSNVEGSVDRFLEVVKASSAGKTHENWVAFVVGYDAMLQKTISELVIKKFPHPILSASTLTEPLWQPEPGADYDNVYTVAPILRKKTSATPGDTAVVFAFSRETLSSALYCAKDWSGSRAFVNCWQDSPKVFDTVHLVNGDSITRLAVTNKWRSVSQL